MLLVLLVIPFLYWQWFPALDTIAFAGRDPSTHSVYYQPLLGYPRGEPARVRPRRDPGHLPALGDGRGRAGGRARGGWERQLDYAFDEQFYDGTLTAASYHAWLVANGVRYVALPDTRLDPSSAIEADLIRRGQPYLKPVWHSAHWKVWEFLGYRGLVDGPARLESLSTDAFRLRVTGPGPMTVHIHDSPHWAVDGEGCTTASPDGWTVIRDVPLGEVKVEQALRGDALRPRQVAAHGDPSARAP